MRPSSATAETNGPAEAVHPNTWPVGLGSVFERVQEVVAPRLRWAVDRLPASVRDVVGYHFGWLDESGRPASGSAGKLLRPALTILSAEAVGATADRAVDAAVAVELMHNFSLLHDDVIDADPTRRHRPTVWSLFGVPTAILAGDALLALAIEALAEAPQAPPDSVPTLCAALRELIDGQYQDVAFERRGDVTIDDWLAMAGGKTAALLRCACELGASHGGGTKTQVTALAQFGWHLGVAFQIVDDLLGIWGNPTATGKPTLSDLRTRKKTLPVVAALTGTGVCSKQLAETYLRPDPLNEQDLTTVATLIERAGGRDRAHTDAKRRQRLALGYLTQAHPARDAYDALAAIAALVTRRDR